MSGWLFREFLNGCPACNAPVFHLPAMNKLVPSTVILNGLVQTVMYQNVKSSNYLYYFKDVLKRGVGYMF